MGCDCGGEFEGPIHEVFLESYWMDETPVTNRQFMDFVEATGYSTEAERAGAAWGYRSGRYQSIAGSCWRSYAAQERLDHPVILVSWNDAMAYAQWSGKFLPTEAQWERAARAGREQQLYPWGNEAPDGSQCNFARSPKEIPPTSTVRAFPANDLGLYDMVGNVWQWCCDWYQSDAYVVGNVINLDDRTSNELRVRRGGAWNVIQPFRLRAANRGALPQGAFAPNVGFRCVLPLVVPAPDSSDRKIQVDLRLRVLEVERILNTLRPAMEADGGGVELAVIEGDVIFLRLVGTCLVCPSAVLTLREGLDRTLRRELPWVKSVQRV